MFLATVIAIVMVIVAVRSTSKILRNTALIAAALVGCMMALKIFIHTLQWALSSLFVIALLVALVWFLLKGKSE